MLQFLGLLTLITWPAASARIHKCEMFVIHNSGKKPASFEDFFCSPSCRTGSMSFPSLHVTGDVQTWCLMMKCVTLMLSARHLHKEARDVIQIRGRAQQDQTSDVARSSKCKQETCMAGVVFTGDRSVWTTRDS